LRNLRPGCRSPLRIYFYLHTKEIIKMPENDDSKDLLENKAEDTDQTTAGDENGTDANSDNETTEDTPGKKPKRPVSEARLRANRENAKKSTGPRTPEGKERSSLNATRHGILAQVILLPEEDMRAYNKFTAEYAAGLNPVGTVEIQLAHACADIQFRLHRIAAAEHNLFAIGHEENGANWNTGNSESHAALTFADTLRRSKDPIATVTLYEQRLSRRLLQTLKQLREIQSERRKLQQEQLDEMWTIVSLHPTEINTIEPEQLGFVCSTRDWRLYLKRRMLLETAQKQSENFPKPINSRKVLRWAA
jgi:hypothetical protein